MIEEDYVSFEIAKLLKEKGFYSEDCFAFYNENGDIGFLQTFGDMSDYLGDNNIDAPTHQMALKWLREVHHYYIQIMLDSWACGGHLGYYVVIQKTDSDFEIMLQDVIDEVFYQTYEESCEAALLYVLKNLI
jgi:hypothetical protein